MNHETKQHLEDLMCLKDQISLEIDQIRIADKYGDSAEANNELLKMVDIGKKFANANVEQFERDLGIRGTGAVPELAALGLEWLGSFLSRGEDGHGQNLIHANFVDEALRRRFVPSFPPVELSSDLAAQVIYPNVFALDDDGLLPVDVRITHRGEELAVVPLRLSDG